MDRHEHHYWEWLKQYPSSGDNFMEHTYMAYHRRNRPFKWLELLFDFVLLIVAVGIVAVGLSLIVGV